jgi:hypothetical protein
MERERGGGGGGSNTADSHAAKEGLFQVQYSTERAASTESQRAQELKYDLALTKPHIQGLDAYLLGAE